MLEPFYPGEYLESTYSIDFEKLYEEGYRGLIFDVDNTLVPHGARADTQAIELFMRLKKVGFCCCLLSNNKEPRVKVFGGDVKVGYIHDAHKPSGKNYIEAMRKMNTNVASTIFIGDQIFTDIYGANRVGIRTILVKPIHPREEIQIVCKRYLEKIVLFFYNRHKNKIREEA